MPELDEQPADGQSPVDGSGPRLAPSLVGDEVQQVGLGQLAQLPVRGCEPAVDRHQVIGVGPHRQRGQTARRQRAQEGVDRIERSPLVVHHVMEPAVALDLDAHRHRRRRRAATAPSIKGR